jgi:hypothetical protein
VDLAPFGVNRAPVIIVLSLPFLYRPALTRLRIKR